MKILDYIKDNILYLDGGFGTMLQAEGLQPGEHPELWNISHPEIITKIHRAYFNSGSNVVSTNTFGANILKFSNEELEEIIKTAIENAKIARETSNTKQKKFIALDIGPTGKLLKPYGDLDFEDAVEVFAKTVRIGVKYGVDLVLIETMNDSYETKAALLAVKENCSLPVFVSNAYGEDGKLMTGATPSAMVAMLEGMGADAIGANCSLGPKQLGDVVDELLRYASVPVLLKPNAGLPKSENGKPVYDVDAKNFAEEMTMYIEKGVRVAGRVGGEYDLYCSAPGKVLLAHADNDFIEEYTSRNFDKTTKNTITEKSDILKELENICKNGYATDKEEFGNGITCVAAPIYDYTGKVIATVGCSAFTFNGQSDRIVSHLLPYVTEAAKTISTRLGK